jgi:carbamoyl-phosphate synthase small subunit
MPKASLLLADGARYDGEGLSTQGVALGEAVFYTGMTGYEEALTDPSYAGQILTFTFPMIGNYGISGEAMQHNRVCVAGAVIKRISRHPSHYSSHIDLGSWLEAQRIPTLLGIDTRALVIALREHGTIAAALAVGDTALAQAEALLADYARRNTTVGLVASVAAEDDYAPQNGTGPRIVVLDCGVKRAILQQLAALGAHVEVLPYSASLDQIRERRPEAVVISPGPGDPADLKGTIDTLRRLLGSLPMFGVCLGHQLLALACGATTFKLPYGHRGGNQPVKDLKSGGVIITAHNHGYAVDGTSLPEDLESTMINLNDGTNEGFRHRRLPVVGVQFHPEAAPGPLDARHLFADWYSGIHSRV